MDASPTVGTLPAWLRRALLLSALWAIPGLIQATTTYAVYELKGDNTLSLLTAILWRQPEWQVWAFATPLIVWVGRRWPITTWTFIPLHLALATAVMSLDIAVYFKLGGVVTPEDPWFAESLTSVLPTMLLKMAFFEMLVYGGVLVADQALQYQRRYREAALVQSQLEARLVEAQLDTLKQQLHPHFLFNTINAITVLMRKGEAAAAIRMLGGLSDLLRRSLTSLKVGVVSLAEELDFISRYLEIETTRFPDRLRVTMEIADDAKRAALPSMLLQPIVENAIEHGIAPKVDGGRISITAVKLGDRLRIEVRDDGVGLDKSERAGHGVGVSNVRKRLEQMYPGSHRFTLEPDSPSGALAVIELPYTEAECEP
jgi:signal transduction histidine kinase